MATRLGLVARSDNRGLGIQTWELYRHLRPLSTLVVDVGPASPYGQHPERYPDGFVVPWADGELQMDDGAIRAWLADLDVVLTCETPYDYRLYTLAHQVGCRTVCQYNWEFYRYVTHPDMPRPDVLAAPSSWNLHRVPGAVLLPFGVDRDRLPYRARTRADTFLHVVGHGAMHDRNGTIAVMEALRWVRLPLTLLVRAQRPMSMPRRGVPACVELETISGDLDNYWDLYQQGDVLLLPRRYGGQSLPMNEALSAGMPVLATRAEPQASWLPDGMLVDTDTTRSFTAQVGPIELHDVNPFALAARMNQLAAEPDLVAELSADADRLADRLAWPNLLPRYWRLFDALAAGAQAADLVAG